MINQIAPVPQATRPLGLLNKGLAQVRHIQARLKSLEPQDKRPETVILPSPLTGAPFMVPILTWID